MNEPEFEELKKNGANHILANLHIIRVFGPEAATVFMRDAAKELTETQLAEASEIIMEQMRGVKSWPTVMDYTSRPPY
jgi:hypothetical protein